MPKKINKGCLSHMYFTMNYAIKIIFFKFYTECSNTLNKKNKEIFMVWWPMSLDVFLEKFRV